VGTMYLKFELPLRSTVQRMQNVIHLTDHMVNKRSIDIVPQILHWAFGSENMGNLTFQL
jgi:hypothetical protein